MSPAITKKGRWARLFLTMNKKERRNTSVWLRRYIDIKILWLCYASPSWRAESQLVCFVQPSGKKMKKVESSSVCRRMHCKWEFEKRSIKQLYKYWICTYKGMKSNSSTPLNKPINNPTFFLHILYSFLNIHHLPLNTLLRFDSIFSNSNSGPIRFDSIFSNTNSALIRFDSTFIRLDSTRFDFYSTLIRSNRIKVESNGVPIRMMSNRIRLRLIFDSIRQLRNARLGWHPQGSNLLQVGGRRTRWRR